MEDLKSTQSDIKILLPSETEIRESAEEWVFDINGMKWSNNDDSAGDNYGSFMAGAKWVISLLKSQMQDINLKDFES